MTEYPSTSTTNDPELLPHALDLARPELAAVAVRYSSPEPRPRSDANSLSTEWLEDAPRTAPIYASAISGRGEELAAARRAL